MSIKDFYVANKKKVLTAVAGVALVIMQVFFPNNPIANTIGSWTSQESGVTVTLPVTQVPAAVDVSTTN